MCEANLVVVLYFSHVFLDVITSGMDSASYEGARKRRFRPTKVKSSFQPSGFNLSSLITMFWSHLSYGHYFCSLECVE